MSTGEAKALLAHHLLNYWVAALINKADIGVIELRLAVIPFAGEGAPADEDVDFGHGGRGFFECIGVFEDGFD